MNRPSDSIDPRGTHRPRRTGVVRADGAELAVYEWGAATAEPLVLVHGLSDTHLVWADVAVLLADGFRVVAYDVRGHGRSTGSGALADYRLDRLADDLFAVLDHVGAGRPVHVCGHGWGAVQVWEAVCDPRAGTGIASFTAIAGPNLDHVGLLVREVLRRPERIPGLVADCGIWRHRGRAARVAAQRLAFPPRVRTRAIELLGGIATAHAPFAPSWRADLGAGARIARANLAHHLLRPRARHTAVPVQLVVDTTDVFVPAFLYHGSARWVDRLWRSSIPADHWLPVTEPLLVAEAVANFVDDLSAANAPYPGTGTGER